MLPHKKNVIKNVMTGIITVSTTRNVQNDKSGEWIANFIHKEGHTCKFRHVVPDDLQIISDTVVKVLSMDPPHVLLITGGTGISSDDVTIEAVRPLFSKELTAFGALFAMLSYEEIDSAALLSRAVAGVIEHSAVFCMPGSLKAVKLACKALIFPELGHITKHLGP